MAVVKTFLNDAEAEIAASALQAAGINVTIHRDDGGGTYPSLDLGGIQLLVPDTDLDAARDVLTTAAEFPADAEDDVQ